MSERVMCECKVCRDDATMEQHAFRFKMQKENEEWKKLGWFKIKCGDRPCERTREAKEDWHLRFGREGIGSSDGGVSKKHVQGALQLAENAALEHASMAQHLRR